MAPQALDDAPPSDEVAGATGPGGRPPHRRSPRRRSPNLAAGLSVVPGAGQLYNGQPRKALAFLLGTLLTIGPAILLITAGERLGTNLLDHRHFALFLLVAFASILVFLGLFLLGLALWASAVVDARRSAEGLTGGDEAAGGRWWFFRL